MINDTFNTFVQEFILNEAKAQLPSVIKRMTKKGRNYVSYKSLQKEMGLEDNDFDAMISDAKAKNRYSNKYIFTDVEGEPAIGVTAAKRKPKQKSDTESGDVTISGDGSGDVDTKDVSVSGQTTGDTTDSEDVAITKKKAKVDEGKERMLLNRFRRFGWKGINEYEGFPENYASKSPEQVIREMSIVEGPNYRGGAVVPADREGQMLQHMDSVGIPDVRYDYKKGTLYVPKKYVKKAESAVNALYAAALTGTLKPIKVIGESEINEGYKQGQKVDFKDVVYKIPSRDGKTTFVIATRDTSGMAGKQDPYHMLVLDKSGRVIMDYGSHPSFEGAKKFAKNNGLTESKASDALLKALRDDYSSGMHDFQDVAAHVKNIHYGQLIKGAETLAKHGKVTYDEKNMKIGLKESEELNEDIKLTKTDKNVIHAFIEKREADNKNFYTDGKQLDGNWMGGSGIAFWEKGKIVFGVSGARSRQTVQRYIRRNVAPFDINEAGPIDNSILKHPKLKPFMDDPYYRDVLTAKDMNKWKAAFDKLKKVRGRDAVTQVQKALRDAGYKPQTNEDEMVDAYLEYVNAK